MNILVVDDEREIADVVELYLQNDQYTVFKFYTGQDALDCINEKKIEFAGNKLVYTDISYVDLANDLGFASHSHFIKIFKKYTGMTPAEYRNKKYRKHFIDR